MPPIARTLGLILLGICPAALPAQTVPPPDQGTAPPSYRTEAPAWSPTLANRPLATAPDVVSAPLPPSGDVVPASYLAPTNAPAKAAESRAVTLSPPHHASDMRLPARGQKTDAKASPRGWEMLLTTGGALAFVIGLILVLGWTFRRAAPGGSSLLPSEVVEVLGRAPLAQRQQVQLLRCGKKLVLVSVTPNGAETLTEITEPMEVDRLAGLCRERQPGSATAAFRQMLDRYDQEIDDSTPFEEETPAASDARRGPRRPSWEGRDV